MGGSALAPGARAKLAPQQRPPPRPPAAPSSTLVAAEAGTTKPAPLTVVPRGVPPPPPTQPALAALFHDLCRAFEAERRLGHAINNCQPPDSFARLDAAVRGLVGAYCASGAADWRQFRVRGSGGAWWGEGGRVDARARCPGHPLRSLRPPPLPPPPAEVLGRSLLAPPHRLQRRL